ncbi:MAG: 3-deoxy-D-manno-octulosonic acid kinase [Gammaproteobacteria bacterium]
MELTRFGIWRKGMRCLIYDPGIPGDLLSLWTNPTSGKTLPNSLKRGSVRSFEVGDNEYVHRHYFRGGYPSRLIRDRYLWIGYGHSRPWREFVLLEKMKRNGLPVPTPALACVDRAYCGYTADLVTVRLSGLSLAQCMDAGVAIDWSEIGRTIRRFHDQGIDHRDLNIHNIFLVNGERVYLLDFDRARERRVRVIWARRNLCRLKRSLAKSGHASGLKEGCWARLMEGYLLG